MRTQEMKKKEKEYYAELGYEGYFHGSETFMASTLDEAVKKAATSAPWSAQIRDDRSALFSDVFSWTHSQ